MSGVYLLRLSAYAGWCSRYEDKVYYCDKNKKHKTIKHPVVKCVSITTSHILMENDEQRDQVQVMLKVLNTNSNINNKPQLTFNIHLCCDGDLEKLGGTIIVIQLHHENSCFDMCIANISSRKKIFKMVSFKKVRQKKNPHMYLPY